MRVAYPTNKWGMRLVFVMHAIRTAMTNEENSSMQEMYVRPQKNTGMRMAYNNNRNNEAPYANRCAAKEKK
jgi:hypothetical protein